MTKIINKINQNEKGASLIEVLLAIMLMGIVGTAFFMALFIATRSIAIADDETTAESLAKSQMEYVKQLEYIDADTDDVALYDELDVSGSSEYDRYSVVTYDRFGQPAPTGKIISIPWNSESNSEVSIDRGLQKIELEIFHDNQKVFELEGYKVDDSVY